MKRESQRLKNTSEEKEAILSCEELEESIMETRILLGHIAGVTSESAKRTYIVLNKKLLLLWQDFFKKCPRIAKRCLREDTRSSALASSMGIKGGAGPKFCWNCYFLNEKDAACCEKCGKAIT